MRKFLYSHKLIVMAAMLGFATNALAASCAPELDPGSIAGGLALLTGSVALFGGKRKKH